MRSCIKSVRSRAGVALIVALMFVVIFTALGVCIATMSGSNVQIASNHHNLNAALGAAQSGQEILRYWLSRVRIASSTPLNQYLTEVIAAVQAELADSGVTGLSLAADGSITAVTLDSATGRNFDGRLMIDPNQPTILQVCITGYSGQALRTVITSYSFEPYEFPIFNYGLATKGPLNFPGNPTITAVNEAWEADMFVESLGSALAVEVLGNTNFDGDINIGSASANVYFDGDVQIAGDHGQAAIDNHVHIGMDSPEFPVPDTDYFRHYATGATIDSSTDTTDNMVLVNARIAAGANPHFTGNVQIQGVLFIEAPNIVIFDGNADIKGMIVADGDAANPGTNSMTFNGNFQSGPFPGDSQFDNVRMEEGSSVLAPGFGMTLTGNFSSLGGVMAVSGFHLAGNAGALVEGTIVNYSGSPTLVDGNATLNFDRAASVKIPAGFDLYRELDYEPSLYCEAGI